MSPVSSFKKREGLKTLFNPSLLPSSLFHCDALPYVGISKKLCMLSLLSLLLAAGRRERDDDTHSHTRIHSKPNLDPSPESRCLFGISLPSSPL